jgi:hypothetical protein
LSSPWTECVWRAFRAGNLTRTCRDVLLTLHHYRDGGLVPSHRTLAGRAKCSVKSVQRALQTARSLGLVDWVGRRVRALWRSLQASNAYRLLMPESAPTGVKVNALRTDGQNARGLEEKEKTRPREAQTALAELMRAAAKAPDLLAARREAWAARFKCQGTPRGSQGCHAEANRGDGRCLCREE